MSYTFAIATIYLSIVLIITLTSNTQNTTKQYFNIYLPSIHKPLYFRNVKNLFSPKPYHYLD